jgi:hypothetical protein
MGLHSAERSFSTINFAVSGLRLFYRGILAMPM